MMQEHLETAKTHTVGILAMVLPWLVSFINPILQFISLVLGIYLVMSRIKHDREDREKNGPN